MRGARALLGRLFALDGKESLFVRASSADVVALDVNVDDCGARARREIFVGDAQHGFRDAATAEFGSDTDVEDVRSWRVNDGERVKAVLIVGGVGGRVGERSSTDEYFPGQFRPQMHVKRTHDGEMRFRNASVCVCIGTFVHNTPATQSLCVCWRLARRRTLFESRSSTGGVRSRQRCERTQRAHASLTHHRFSQRLARDSILPPS